MKQKVFIISLLLARGLCQIFRPLFGRVSELEMDFSKLSGDKYPIEE